MSAQQFLNQLGVTSLMLQEALLSSIGLKSPTSIVIRNITDGGNPEIVASMYVSYSNLLVFVFLQEFRCVWKTENFKDDQLKKTNRLRRCSAIHSLLKVQLRPHWFHIPSLPWLEREAWRTAPQPTRIKGSVT